MLFSLSSYLHPINSRGGEERMRLMICAWDMNFSWCSQISSLSLPPFTLNLSLDITLISLPLICSFPDTQQVDHIPFLFPVMKHYKRYLKLISKGYATTWQHLKVSSFFILLLLSMDTFFHLPILFLLFESRKKANEWHRMWPDLLTHHLSVFFTPFLYSSLTYHSPCRENNFFPSTFWMFHYNKTYAFTLIPISKRKGEQIVWKGPLFVPCCVCEWSETWSYS